MRNGQRAFIRFPAFNQRTTPQLEGVVSLGRFQSRPPEKPECRNLLMVRVTLPPSERRRLGGLEVGSGMPVEIFLQIGSRTMMSYLLKPITDQLLRTFNWSNGPTLTSARTRGFPWFLTERASAEAGSCFRRRPL